MSPATIRTRTVSSGKRYDVRYRVGGRGYPILHGGTFRTLTEARTRRDLISGELAAGRDPRLLLAALGAAPAPTWTLAQRADQWYDSRVDVKASTRAVLADHVKRIKAALGSREVVTPADVRAWIADMIAEGLAPATIKNYVGTLRQILDTVEGDNPARDRSVRLPRTERKVVSPPSRQEVDRILAAIPKRWRLPLRVLEQTGMRISEVSELAWRDVDVAGSRFRIGQGKTTAARRWVQVPEWLMQQVHETTAPDDRTPDRLVFPAFERKAAATAMRRACKAAGVAHYSPHALRHRYASIQIKRGVPVTEIAAQVGHSRTSLTHDTYAHVLLAEEDA